MQPLSPEYNNLISQGNYVDSWLIAKEKVGDGKTKTTRIDYIFVPTGTEVLKAEVRDTIASDHKPLLVTIAVWLEKLMTGYVKSIKSDKGFGFIKSDNMEYFFHRSDLYGHWDDLVEDFEKIGKQIQVEFERKESTKGPRATNVRLING